MCPYQGVEKRGKRSQDKEKMGEADLAGMGGLPTNSQKPECTQMLAAKRPRILSPFLTQYWQAQQLLNILLFLGDAQQLCLCRRAICQPAFAILAHGAHAILLRSGSNVSFRCAIMDLRADLIGGQQ
jgi:hypothetical protein